MSEVIFYFFIGALFAAVCIVSHVIFFAMSDAEDEDGRLYKNLHEEQKRKQYGRIKNKYEG